MSTTTQWARLVDGIVRGERPKQPAILLGPKPTLLKSLRLAPADLVMATGKIAICRKEHPQVPLEIWHRLPVLMAQPLAVVPSARRDGSLVIVLIVEDTEGDPVVVPVLPGQAGGPNVVLSVYGKSDGKAWVAKQIARALEEGRPHYVSNDFAATMPQPGSDLIRSVPSSPGPIPADGTAKPIREVLRLSRKVKDR